MAYLYMFRHVWHYAGKERWKIIVYIICHVCSTTGELLQPYAFAQVFNVLQRNEADLLVQVLQWIGVYGLGFLIFEVFHRIARFMERRVAFRSRQRFTTDMYTRLYHLPMKWHTDYHSGNIINRVMIAGAGLSEFGQRQYNYINKFVRFWGPLVILYGISYEISLIAVGLLLLTTLVIVRFDAILVPIVRAQNEVLHQFSATFFDYVSNIKTILTLRLGSQTERELDHKFGKFYPELTGELMWNQTKCFVVSLCILLLEAGIMLYYIWRQQQLRMPIMIGTVAAIFQYLRQLSDAYGWFAGHYYDIVRWKTDFQTVQPILEAYEEHHTPDEGKLAAWNCIQIAQLNFSYNDGRQELQEVALHLTSTAKIALVGESGSGKSTILNILRGLYDAPEAHVKIDGQHYQGLSALSAVTTLVPQDPEIFENTLLYNISVGIPVNQQELDMAMELARFTPVLQRMPDGLSTDIREKGVNLSGGEKQRLALARGILAAKNSSILLLDEPTSSVDTHNELLIYEHIFRTFQDKCILSSIHRLHLLDLFDYVYVMDQGQIVQQGTFEELRSQSGPFAMLWKKYQREISAK